jgi:NAD(P)-dependent dehydrogenase (short-subunit alcohol dehydrogenase family)
LAASLIIASAYVAPAPPAIGCHVFEVRPVLASGNIHAMDRWTADDIPDLSGRTAVVTGANSGLGLETAAALAAHGALVVMASRNTDRLQAAMSEVRRRHRDAEVKPVILDLASLASVRAAASSILGTHPKLDLLVDNAGVMAIPRAETADGFEMQFGTNYLGHFALTGLLLPAMLGTPGSRIVVVTSQVRRVGRVDFDDLHGRKRYGRWKAYAQSKFADLIFTVELGRRLRAARAETIAVAAHPGYAATNLQSGTSWFQNTYYSIGNTLFAQPAYAGAWPSLYAATAAGVHDAELYGPGQAGGIRGYPKRDRVESRALDPDVGRRLWEVSVEATGIHYDAISRPGAA